MQLERRFATKLPQVYAQAHWPVINGTTSAFCFSVLVAELATRVTTLANTIHSCKNIQIYINEWRNKMKQSVKSISNKLSSVCQLRIKLSLVKTKLKWEIKGLLRLSKPGYLFVTMILSNYNQYFSKNNRVKLLPQ